MTSLQFGAARLSQKIMTQSQLEKDVANYVLAYLARQGYKNTMSKFCKSVTFFLLIQP
ncbi:hypothetical protein GBAR_LOCUS8685 [Geodia barretti]|uniref:LisH domain-containing protein n=1 Tax=Geodia barretti TaxID=519541 RepID=A0AA35WAV1_GEOBA|nr:hypothetical protein GBAR_LOCUS8685 [Geodia barretti]